MTDQRKMTAEQRQKAAQSYPHGGGANDSCLTMLVFPAVLMFLLVFVLGQFGLAVLLP